MAITRAEMVRIVNEVLAALKMDGVSAENVTWIRMEPDGIYVEHTVADQGSHDVQLTTVAVDG